MQPPRKVIRIATSDATGVMSEDLDATSNNLKSNSQRKVSGPKDLLEMPVDIISEVSRRSTACSP